MKNENMRILQEILSTETCCTKQEKEVELRKLSNVSIYNFKDRSLVIISVVNSREY